MCHSFLIYKSWVRAPTGRGMARARWARPFTIIPGMSGGIIAPQLITRGITARDTMRTLAATRGITRMGGIIMVGAHVGAGEL